MPHDKLNALGGRLKELREAVGLSQQGLADRAGVHLSIVFKIEQGTNKNPRIGSLLSLAEALGVGVDRLIGLEGGEATLKRATRKPRGPKRGA